MKLAVNYSEAAVYLIDKGDANVDLFKVPDWDDLIEEAQELRPVSVHFPFHVGAARESVDLDRAAGQMSRTGTESLNLHVVPSQERFPHLDVADVSPAAKSEVAQALTSDVAGYCERFGAAAVIIENVIYRGPERKLLRSGIEPDVLGEVVSATGCGFLLDLSHALITARSLGMDEWKYLDSLPVHALEELHVSGIHLLEGGLKDHLPLTEDDWQYLSGVIGRIKAGAWPSPRQLAFEYGGIGPVFSWRSEPSVLREQLPRLAEMVASAASGYSPTDRPDRPLA